MNIDMVRGEQFIVLMDLLDEDGNKIDSELVTEITMTCRKQPYEQSNILFQKKFTDEEITYDSESQEYEIHILEEDTKDLQYGTYGFDIKVESGELIQKFVGTLNIKEEYTMGYENESE